ncbi:MAG: SpoIID/LytB domain-containing protein [bacterium]
MKRVLFLCIFFSLFFFLAFPLQADQLEDLQKQINDLNKTFSDISKANQTNETQLQELQKRLDSIKSQVAILEREIEKKQVQVTEGEKAFAIQQKLLNQRAKSYYKNMGKNSFSIVNLLLSENISESLQNYFYQKTLVDEDRKAIIRIAVFIKQVEDKKKELEAESAQLAIVKTNVDKQSQFLAGEVAKSKKYLGELQSKIASLTAQQQQILAQKLAGLNISRSSNTAGRCDSDLTNGRDPGFSPKFAFFTFGTPNRIGLNQYGAKFRSSFQGHEDILRAYYNNVNFENRDNITIKVQGHDSMPLETYLLGVCEMPESWPMEALKAQVIAARSYALAYTNNGANEICTTESCQVYCGEKTGQWKTAVQETAGKVMTQGGNPIKAWFSSTHGGYIFSSGEIGWSNTDWTKHANDFEGSVGSFDELKNKAYDRDSPWFYCDWGSRGEYNKTAWLKPNELADIVNVILLARKDSNTRSHLYQPDQPNPAGTDTWDAGRVRQELGGSAYNNIESVSVSADFGYGRTTNISVSGDGKNDSFSMSEFKDFFNLRAPANIQIVGPLFNVEKR